MMEKVLKIMLIRDILSVSSIVTQLAHSAATFQSRSALKCPLFSGNFSLEVPVFLWNLKVARNLFSPLLFMCVGFSRSLNQINHDN